MTTIRNWLWPWWDCLLIWPAIWLFCIIAEAWQRLRRRWPTPAERAWRSDSYQNPYWYREGSEWVCHLDNGKTLRSPHK